MLTIIRKKLYTTTLKLQVVGGGEVDLIRTS